MEASESHEFPGAILLEGFFQSFAAGILGAQAVKYCSSCAADSHRKRAYVALVVFLSLYVPQALID